MAIFTTTDRDNVKSALVTAATEGFASVSLDGQSFQTYSLEQLQSLLQVILQDLASTSTSTHGGMKLRQMVPGECG